MHTVDILPTYVIPFSSHRLPLSPAYLHFTVFRICSSIASCESVKAAKVMVFAPAVLLQIGILLLQHVYVDL